MNDQTPEGVMKSPVFGGCGVLVIGAGLSLYHCTFGPILDWPMPQDSKMTVIFSVVALLVVATTAAYCLRSRRNIAILDVA